MRSAVASHPSAEESGRDVQVVEMFLHTLSRRLRLIRLLQSTCTCVICSCLALILLRIISAFVFQRQLSFFFNGYIVAATVIVPAAAAIVRIAWSKYEQIQLARYADDRLGLKDRLATAVTLRLSLMDSAFATSIARDASLAVAAVDFKKLLPFAWRPLYTSAILALVVAVVVLYIPLSPLAVVRLPALPGLSNPFGTARPIVSPGPKPQSTVQPRLVKGGATSQVPKRNTPASTESAIKNDLSTHGGKSLSPSGSGQVSGTSASSDAAKNGKTASAASDVDKMINGLKSPQGKTPATGPKSSSPNSTGKGSNSQNGQGSGSKDAGAPPPGIPTLGDKLREYASRLSQRELTSGEQQQAAQNLGQVNHKLDGLQMPKTQQNLNDAEQNLNSGQQIEGISNIRQAAYNADHEGATPPPGTGAPATGTKGEVAIPAKSGQSATQNGSAQSGSSATGKDGTGQSKEGGKGKDGNGQSSSGGQNGNSASNGSNGKSGAGNGSGNGQIGKDVKSTPNNGGSGKGYGGGTQKPTFGAPRLIDPSKLGKPTKYQFLPLPVSSPTGRSSETKGDSVTGQASKISTVPYSNINENYKMTHEQGVTTEQIPPAYSDVVKRYFSSSHPGH